MTTEHGTRQAWLIANSRLIELQTEADRAMPYALNQHRVVAGWSTDPNEAMRATIWTNGTRQPLSDLGFESVALDINDSGIVVGEVRIERNGRMAAARWRNGQLETFVPPEPYNGTREFRINAHGLTVGYAMRNRAASDFFLCPLDGSPQIIAQGEAYGVNDWGWVAGRSGEKGALLWHPGEMIWLDALVSPEWTISWPFRLINDLRMVGGRYSYGIERAVLLVLRFD